MGLSVHTGRRMSLGCLTSVVVAGGLVAATPAGADPVLPANCALGSSGIVTCSFGYTGAEQTFTVPSGISQLTITTTGAQGSEPGSYYALGGTAKADFSVGSSSVFTPGQTLYVEVGGQPSQQGVSGGFNGGGDGGSGFYEGDGGGGASDVRTSPRTVALTTQDTRVAVGGGGGGDASCSEQAVGGGAGQPGNSRCDGSSLGYHGGAASAGAPGIGGSPDGGDGSLGQGGTGGSHNGHNGGGGGGGGYFGGGGGGGLTPGGGGSSYYSPESTNSTIGAPSNFGNGSVTISYRGAAGPVVFASSTPSAVSTGTTTTVTASGGGSGQPVVISRDASSTAGACTVTSTGDGTASVSFTGPGSCVLDGDQAGNADLFPAPRTQQTISVQSRPSSVTLSTPASAVFGQPVTATALVSVFDGTTPAGTVQFSVAGVAVGSPVAVSSSGSATSPDLSFVAGRQLDPGSYPLDAAFTPSSSNYTNSMATTTALTITKAGTTTSVTVAASSITATVAPVAPGAGKPTGAVTFSVGGSSVGTAQLSNGTATLTYTVPAGAQASAAYAGDIDFTASSGSTARQNPAITAAVTSRQPETRYGWYHGPVTVTFTCTPGSAPLTAACPAPVTLTTDGANQTVTKTITATDGGTATATVTGLNIDTAKPTLTGPANGATYLGTAPACAAADTLSGIATCTAETIQVSHSGTGLNPTVYSFAARATDKAGNTSTTTGRYTVLGVYLAGGTYRNGTFYVKYGHSYPVTVTGYSSTPTFQYAVGYNDTPTTTGPKLTATGTKTWAVTLPINKTFASRHDWNIAVLTGDGVHHVIHLHQ